MKQRRWSIGIAWVALIAFTLACGSTSTPTPAPDSTPTVYVAPTVYVPPEEETPGEATAAPSPEPTAAPPAPTAEPAPLTRIVFTDGGNLWIVEGDAAPRQLTSSGADSAPRISPDGRWVLFNRDLPPGPAELLRFELRAIGTDGSGERLLVAADALPGELGTPMGWETEVLLDRLPYQVAWRPDSRAVVFNTIIQGGYGLAHNDDLWQADVGGGGVDRLLEDGDGGQFAISPDGAYIVVANPTTVAMTDAGGGNRRVMVTFGAVNTASEYAYRPLASWAPDSSHALVLISDPEPFAEGATGDVWRLPAAGGAVHVVTLTGSFLFDSMEGTLWSPDLSYMAYTVPVEPLTNNRDLVIAAGDGSAPTVYANGWVQWLGWARSHYRFTYWRDNPGEVYLGQLGEVAVRLVPPDVAERVDTVRWLDADSFVYLAGTRGAFDLCVGEVGGGYRTIASLAGDFPSFDVYP
ncbi:MAG: PD40 domain-containing protein [Anaerolineae bacterium]|nr:PD40 domain-containing protein [Anaerolineae bacterium]